jgi:hypothetical protein
VVVAGAGARESIALGRRDAEKALVETPAFGVEDQHIRRGT